MRRMAGRARGRIGVNGRGRHTNRLIAWLIGALLLLPAVASAQSANPNPLQPIDASSPRATLEGFLDGMDDLYRRMGAVMQAYAASDRLYLTKAERRQQAEALAGARKIVGYLDVSHISPVIRIPVAAERAIQLKEILDRIEVPPLSEIPDAEAMAKSGARQWRLPGTEIDIVAIPDSRGAARYLVAAETVDRLPEFYERVKALPYKPGTGKELSEIYRRLTADDISTLYEAYTSSPVGLQRVLPLRWFLQLPSWVRARLVEIAVWQWLGVGLGLMIGALIVWGMRRLARRIASRAEGEARPRWPGLLTPFAALLVAGFLIPALCTVFRIGGMPNVIVTLGGTAIVYLSAAWLALIGGGVLAEAVVSSEHLRRGSLDSQLIRLGMRLAGIAVAIGLLIQGAYELGFPSYSVLAGLGVGGLAVALAARDSLANLLGSLLIMLEKPFRIGQVIRVAGIDGTVEDVGFRSTRIRTFDNSLVSIPNNSIVNATVENLSLRAMRRQRLVVQITYATPRAKLAEFALGIERLITEHPATNKTNINVRFNDFGDSSLNILVYFYLLVTDLTSELKYREEILLKIMELAETLGVEFAFPTRTLIVEGSPGEARAAGDILRPAFGQQSS
jgi:MscS family membrane protein